MLQTIPKNGAAVMIYLEQPQYHFIRVLLFYRRRNGLFG